MPKNPSENKEVLKWIEDLRRKTKDQFPFRRGNSSRFLRNFISRFISSLMDVSFPFSSHVLLYVFSSPSLLFRFECSKGNEKTSQGRSKSTRLTLQEKNPRRVSLSLPSVMWFPFVYSIPFFVFDVRRHHHRNQKWVRNENWQNSSERTWTIQHRRRTTGRM